MLEMMLLNVIKGLVMDPAQDLKDEHIMPMIEEQVGADNMEALDKVVDAMPNNAFKNVKELFG